MANGQDSTDSNHDEGFLPKWRLKTTGVIGPDERLPAGQTLLAGIQHVVAMFGSTAIAPILMGFHPNIAILFSGIGTLLFFLCVRGRVPSYLGSSFAFIAVVIAATGYGSGPNPNIPRGARRHHRGRCALYGDRTGGRPGCVGRKLMPPVVTGAIVAAIGLNLAPVAVKAAVARRSTHGGAADSARRGPHRGPCAGYAGAIAGPAGRPGWLSCLLCCH
jgi:xanthine/uracil permease